VEHQYRKFKWTRFDYAWNIERAMQEDNRSGAGSLAKTSVFVSVTSNRTLLTHNYIVEVKVK